MQKEMLLFIHDGDIDVQEFFVSLSPGIQGHSRRVARMAERLFLLTEEEGLPNEGALVSEGVERIRRAILYHDIGMTMIPERVLFKVEELTGAETRVIQRHASYGGKLLERYRKSRRFASQEDAMWRLAAETALNHHERWDGRGYPFGILATAIPLISRIAAVVDSYDAIVHGAPYRMPLPPEYALLEIVDNAGTQFDPRLVDIFKRHTSEFHRMVIEEI